MAAFKRAAANGFGAELDVHLMKDGKLAVIHDASLLRTAGADVEIEDLTAEALEQYPLEGTEQRIPLLEEVLPLFTDRAGGQLDRAGQGDYGKGRGGREPGHL